MENYDNSDCSHYDETSSKICMEFPGLTACMCGIQANIWLTAVILPLLHSVISPNGLQMSVIVFFFGFKHVLTY